MNILCTGNKYKNDFYDIFDSIFKKYNDKDNLILLDSFVFKDSYSNDIFDNIYSPIHNIDLVISLGGDGSILSAVSRMNEKQIPVLGIHIGELGFLNQANLKDYEDIIDEIVSNNCFNYSKHALLTASIISEDKEVSMLHSLNDFAINQKTYSRLLKMDVEINGEFLNMYNCDGLIICTPLGSTAYSLSAGGPIVAQDVDSIIITPVSPHSLSARPIVINSDSEITITFPKLKNEIRIYADGQTSKILDSNSKVIIKKSKISCKIIKPDNINSYYSKLRNKLRWFGEHRS